MFSLYGYVQLLWLCSAFMAMFNLYGFAGPLNGYGYGLWCE